MGREEFNKLLEEMRARQAERERRTSAAAGGGVKSPATPTPPVASTPQPEQPSKSVMPIPQSVGVGSVLSLLLAALPLVLKNLPLILGILTGLNKFFSSFRPANNDKVKIDQESLANLIAELTEKEVSRIVNSHRDKVRVWVPSEEDKQRNIRLDELERILLEDAARSPSGR